MHRLGLLGRTVKLLLLATISNPLAVHGNINREDLCGLSVNASEFPGIGKFSSIEGIWTIPKMIPRGDETSSQSSYISSGVSLCCGEDCSTRLSAGFLAWDPDPGELYTASPMIQITPQFDTRGIYNTRLHLNASDTLWTRLEIRSPTLASITFTKLETSTSNITVTVDIDVGQKNGVLDMKIYRDEDKAPSNWSFPIRFGNLTAPSLCGDSAWWYLSDEYDLSDWIERVNPLARFTPVLISGHGLGTTEGKSFPADLPLSGQAQFWDMVRGGDGQTGEMQLCKVRGFVDTGMTLLQSPQPWGV
ncbi:hypothetical protein C8A00DRAFT_18018 [Chaetomidium leptoderma]|uniref:Uncharacterized protein n=1 Tax=Chaetomidium leptoderma TaxID=669021 RepID=A0AAN6ZU85_9PEZI|nr:hypothetical protein C8A00DRAFT_18018 [Chaetomidium leptoderma]